MDVAQLDEYIMKLSAIDINLYFLRTRSFSEPLIGQENFFGKVNLSDSTKKQIIQICYVTSSLIRVLTKIREQLGKSISDEIKQEFKYSFFLIDDLCRFPNNLVNPDRMARNKIVTPADKFHRYPEYLKNINSLMEFYNECMPALRQCYESLIANHETKQSRYLDKIAIW